MKFYIQKLTILFVLVLISHDGNAQSLLKFSVVQKDDNPNDSIYSGSHKNDILYSLSRFYYIYDIKAHHLIWETLTKDGTHYDTLNMSNLTKDKVVNSGLTMVIKFDTKFGPNLKSEQYLFKEKIAGDKESYYSIIKTPNGLTEKVYLIKEDD